MINGLKEYIQVEKDEECKTPRTFRIWLIIQRFIKLIDEYQINDEMWWKIET